MLASLTQSMSPTDNHLQMKMELSLRESHCTNKFLLRALCVQSSSCSTENKLKGIFEHSLSHYHLKFCFVF